MGAFAAIPAVRLSNGVEMPVMALGTGGWDNRTAEAAVVAAAAQGLLHVHAAYDYYNLPGVRAGLAAVIREHGRERVFVTAMTSPCVHPAAPPVRNVSDAEACYRLTKRELRGLLAALGLRAVDLAMVHGPNEPFGTTGPCSAAANALNSAQWRAYDDLRREGGARAVGVSNYCQSCLEGLRGPTPAANQIQLHVGMGLDPGGLVSYCNRRGIVVQAYSPLAAGAVVASDAVAAIAARANRSAAEAGLRWVRQQGAALVVKAGRAAYLAEDIEAVAGNWTLAPAAMAALDALPEPKGQQEGRPSWGCGR